MKKISEIQELLYGAEPQLQIEMLTLWLEEIFEEINYETIVHGNMLNAMDKVEKQLRDDKKNK